MDTLLFKMQETPNGVIGPNKHALVTLKHSHAQKHKLSPENARSIR